MSGHRDHASVARSMPGMKYSLRLSCRGEPSFRVGASHENARERERERNEKETTAAE